MRPRKKIVIYCSDYVEAERIGFMLRTRLPVATSTAERLRDISSFPDTLLVIIISMLPDVKDYQPQVDQHCSTPVLVWHRSKGATFHEFFEAVQIMLAQKRGPKTPDAPAMQVVQHITSGLRSDSIAEARRKACA